MIDNGHILLAVALNDRIVLYFFFFIHNDISALHKDCDRRWAVHCGEFGPVVGMIRGCVSFVPVVD